MARVTGAGRVGTPMTFAALVEVEVEVYIYMLVKKCLKGVLEKENQL